MTEALMHEVHGSVLKSFQGCRLRYSWEFQQGYVPIIAAEALEFGTAFHRAMEALFDPYTWDMPLVEAYQRAKAVFVGYCEQKRQAHLRAIEAYQLDPEQEYDITQRIEMGCAMLRKVAREVDRKKYTPVSVEEEAFVPVESPLTGQQLFCTCDNCWEKYCKAATTRHRDGWAGLPVFYGVRIDACLVDNEGGYWLVDWKTAAQLLKDPTILELDGQIGSYCWALIKSLKYDFRGFQYVQIFKGIAHAPKQLLTPRLGRAFSIQKNQRTDYKMAKLTFQKYDTQAFEAGMYDEYLEFLKTDGPEFIKWNKVYKTDDQLQTIGEDLYYGIVDMLDRPKIYAESGMHCRWCPFQLPCLERQSRQDYQAMLDSDFEKRDLYFILERERRQRSSV